jgi:hypothetical protein
MAFKYAYWLQPDTQQQLLAELEKQDMQVHTAKKAVCSPLSRKVKLGLVPPEAWQESKVCHRQLSWYYYSRHAGEYLLISSFSLQGYGLQEQIILEHCPSFKPPALPENPEDYARLTASSRYQRHKPEKWDDLSNEDPAELERWMKIMGIRGIRYEDLFVYHCANHANFLEPVYYTQEDGQVIPYSIAGTKYICSACLEMFNIIGERFRRKRVIPCPGAVIFAGLPVNRYIEIQTLS